MKLEDEQEPLCEGCEGPCSFSLFTCYHLIVISALWKEGARAGISLSFALSFFLLFIISTLITCEKEFDYHYSYFMEKGTNVQ